MPANERRQQVLDAAEAVFSVNSYRDVGTAGVAAEAGVSEPTLYRYFDSKRDLYLAMLDRNAKRLLAGWRRLAEESPSAMGGITAIGIQYYTQLKEDPSQFLLRARSLLETGDEMVADHARKVFWETFEFIEGIYRRARDAGEIAADTDVRAQAWLFMSMGGLLDQFLLMGLDPPELDELARMMALVGPPVVAGARVPPPAAKPLENKSR